MNERLKRACTGILVALLALTIFIVIVVIPVNTIQDNKRICQMECEKLNLTLKKVNCEGAPWLIGKVESCDCKILDYVRVKVKT